MCYSCDRLLVNYYLRCRSIVAELSNRDEAAIRRTLLKEFNDASDSPDVKGTVEISKLSWEPARLDLDGSRIPKDKVTSYVSHRKLDNTLTQDDIIMTSVSFEVKVLAERFGIKSLDEVGAKKLHQHMSEYLSRSMSTGIFVSKLVSEARSLGSRNLESVDFARLGHLKVIHNNNAAINSEVTILTSALVICSVMLGVIFSYMTHQSMTRISNAENVHTMGESQHQFLKPEDSSMHQKFNNAILFDTFHKEKIFYDSDI